LGGQSLVALNVESRLPEEKVGLLNDRRSGLVTRETPGSVKPKIPLPAKCPR
jgi:hypothetical protein